MSATFDLYQIIKRCEATAPMQGGLQPGSIALLLPTCDYCCYCCCCMLLMTKHYCNPLVLFAGLGRWCQ